MKFRPLWNSKSDGNRRDRESILANSILSFLSLSLSFSLSVDGFRLLEHTKPRDLFPSSVIERLRTTRYGSLSWDGRAFISNEIIVCLFSPEYTYRRRTTLFLFLLCLLLPETGFARINLTSRIKLSVFPSYFQQIRVNCNSTNYYCFDIRANENI